MTPLESAIKIAAREMSIEHGVGLNGVIELAMLEGARLTQLDLLANKAQYVCTDCGKCLEAPCQPT